MSHQSEDQTDRNTLAALAEVELGNVSKQYACLAELPGASAPRSVRELLTKEIELRSHIKHAQSLYEDMKRDRDKMREQRDTANASMRQTAELTTGGHEVVQEFKVKVKELEMEADKARRVIAGNTDIEDNGSLLDMLNALLARLKYAEDAASKGDKARSIAGGMEERIKTLEDEASRALKMLADAFDIKDYSLIETVKKLTRVPF